MLLASALLSQPFFFREIAGRDQILRLGLALLNHQNRITPTTTTNKIVSFI
jgi:hypothetical protein